MRAREEILDRARVEFWLQKAQANPGMAFSGAIVAELCREICMMDRELAEAVGLAS
jgi:hypothetical protein